MRFAAYAGTSVALATGVLLRALHSRANFYSACVYMSQSNACLMIISNVALLIVGSILFALQHLLYGPLRPSEIEQLSEKAWYAVTETCLAMTIFREELGAWFLIMFVSLLVGKVWGWIGEGRVEILEQQPPTNPRLFHARLSLSLVLSCLFNSYLLNYSISTVRQQARPNMMVMFAFEFALLNVASLSTFLRYGISVREALIIQEQTNVRLQARRQEIQRQRDTAAKAAKDAGEPLPIEPPIEELLDEADIDAPGWEEKSRWVFYLDLATDFVKLFLYLAFFCVLCMFYGMPIHIIRDVALVIRSFYRRVTDFIRYRHATRDMNERYPDASEQDIASQDVCIICREGMQAWPTEQVDRVHEGRDSPIDERLRPKKLQCGHILHFACLRSWLERQQNCPTCRQPVLVTAAETPAQRGQDQVPVLGRPQVNVDGARQNRDAPAGRHAGQNRIRVFNFGPLRIGFGAGQDLQGLEQQLQDPNLQQPRVRDNDVVQQFGFSFGLGRQQRPNSDISTQLTSQDTQAQLQVIEQQIMQNVHDLRLQSEQLAVIRAMQGELARLRIARSSAMLQPYHSQQPFHPTQTQAGRSYIPATHSHPSVSAFTVNPTQERLSSANRDLPQGLAIPEGWTLLPLQPVNDPSVLPNLGTANGSGDIQNSMGLTPPLIPTLRQTASSQNLGNSLSNIASTQSQMNSADLTDRTNTNSMHAAPNQSQQETRSSEVPRWNPTHPEDSSRAAFSSQSSANSRPRSAPRDSGSEHEAGSNSKRATVEDAEENE